MDFASKLTKLREQSGLSQYEVSERLGIKRPRYNAWEQGISKPRADMIHRVAALFHVSIDYLLGQPEDAADMHEKLSTVGELFQAHGFTVKLDLHSGNEQEETEIAGADGRTLLKVKVSELLFHAETVLSQVKNIAAAEEEDWTEEEQNMIEAYKKFLRSQRKQRPENS
ncbi:XRE family transcriptional regulator [Xylanibacillus composti]|uniref:HTH cro/C1-type domain-containing protein n=1 Tax=Xylanibacillus composti TaxID=1572762 RepID=A0A8J4H6A8_9BACL|nr:helix-turn-helix transcriptional regulator [Xylanibacillus composti]MDT9724278.1 XRE family transcriptional regulator [Xylanibacillus composti]GIQ69273.1 hypothetical protein XYCOK13_20970 [Xylanibacillus composti]